MVPEARFRERRSPLSGRPAHPLLSAPQPASITIVHAAAVPEAAGCAVLSIGPRRSMVVTEGDADAEATGPSVDGVDVGQAWTRIRLTGEGGRRILAAGVSLDLASDSFPVGSSAATGFRTIAVVLHASDTDTIDVYAPRSQAESLWQWLVDAAEDAA